MSRLMITAAPETNRWNEGQLISETLISAMAQLVGEADYIHLSQLAAEHALRADNPRVVSCSLCGRDCQR
jgi:hypothetical protein